ncbi:hypothetical protein WA158_004058 [Blastocystis sp. Blastoise]
MPKPGGFSSDTRLRRCVREYIELPETRVPTDSGALEYVTRILPEYKRKPQNILLKEIGRVLSLMKTQNLSLSSSPLPDETNDKSLSTAASADRIIDEIRPLKRRKKSLSTPMNLNDSVRTSYETVDKTSKKTNKEKENEEGDEVDLDAITWTRPTERYSDLAGIETILQDLRELIEYPLSHPEIYTHLGITPPRGILLHGPPGCGKTLLANAIAGELGVPLIKISAPEIVSGMSGESEEKLRKLFDQAIGIAPSILFIDEIDAIIQKRDSSTKGMERRIVAQLQTCMDSLNTQENSQKPVIIIGATNRPDALDTALRRAGRFDREICLGIPDEKAREQILRLLAGKLKLEGDFNFEELAQKTPGYEAAILCVNRIFKEYLLNNPSFLPSTTDSSMPSTIETSEEIPSSPIPIDSIDSLEKVGMDIDTSSSIHTPENASTPYSSSILSPSPTPLSPTTITPATTTTTPASTSLTPYETITSPIPDDEYEKEMEIKERTQVSMRLKTIQQIPEDQLEKLAITMQDFLDALPKVQPSAKREGFATIPNTTWDDIGALDSVREEIRLSVVEPIRNPSIFKHMGLNMPAGVLLYGPPGCGKTLLAKAVSNESRANFISIKGPELLNKYVGESEKAVRQVFERARASSPCVIFFDEIDALCPKRGSDGGNSGVSERMVNMLLTEMDGLEERKQVFVIAATNRPDILDPAMLRPGRLDKLLLVPLPSSQDRISILRTLLKRTPLDKDINIETIATDKRCDGFTGADLSNLVREATLFALRPALLSGATAPSSVTMDNFNDALNKIKPSISYEDLIRYCQPPNANE